VFAAVVSSQDVIKNPLIIGGKVQRGFIIAHSKSIENVAFSNPWSIELDVARLLIKEANWRNCNCFSQVGMAINYYNFDYAEVLGDAYGTSIYVEPLIRSSKRLYFTFRVAFGAVYIPKVYDAETNPLNWYFSSKISFPIILALNINYRFDDNLSLNLSGFYNHISNGGLKLPNKGMNFPTLSLGFEYNFAPQKFPEWKRVKRELDEKTKTKVSFFGTVTRVEAEGDFQEESRFSYGFIASRHKTVGSYSALNFGGEWLSNGYAKRKLERAKLNIDHRLASFVLGHELIFGRFVFNTQIGVYVYAPYEPADEVYQRYSFTYEVNKYIFFGTTLKAHRQVADNIFIILGLNI